MPTLLYRIFVTLGFIQSLEVYPPHDNYIWVIVSPLREQQKKILETCQGSKPGARSGFYFNPQ